MNYQDLIVNILIAILATSSIATALLTDFAAYTMSHEKGPSYFTSMHEIDNGSYQALFMV